MGLKLYGILMYTCITGVMACLHEKGVEFELVPVNMSVGEHKQPLEKKVLPKIKTVKEKSTGGIFLPFTAEAKPQNAADPAPTPHSGDLARETTSLSSRDYISKKNGFKAPAPRSGDLARETIALSKSKGNISDKTGYRVVYFKYADTKLNFNGSKHLIFKENDIVAIIDTKGINDLKPLNKGVLIKV
ncbi:hypothetical protein GIB67_024970 [Kingdonia uniflora]|uniref:GST N-terminal domain-containing protein n=1 Tax=Kingdonia uniflora TaxID=39325 RepID=A0A7J7NZJ4_9MAGN|nr:hypothetical protein GIB67_024970 [Kingdonia uniflora]